MFGGTARRSCPHRRVRPRAPAWPGAVILLAVLAGCAASRGAGPSLPTFSTPPAASPTADRAAAGTGGLPEDCAPLLAPTDVVSLLGRPLDSVAVRSTRGVPEPAVGRTERLACRYTGTPGAPDAGRPLLELNAAGYVDAAAATKQWQVNTAAEDGARRELAIGAAPAVLVERGGESVLLVVYGTGTLTVVLAGQQMPAGRAPAEVAVDLAQRVLPAIARQAPTTTPPALPGSS